LERPDIGYCRTMLEEARASRNHLCLKIT